MRLVVLYRASEFDDIELTAATDAGFFCTSSRMHIQPGDLVVGRYSVLPFYREQEEDIEIAGARLINTIGQHGYIADMQNWIEDLKDLTPETWFRLEDVPKDGPGSFVLKGATNSKKQAWSTSMFARDYAAASTVYSRLCDDGFIGTQPIYIRRYVPLVRLGEAIGGLPLTKEFRFFVCNGEVLAGGFYWAAFQEDIVEQGGVIPDITEVPSAFLEEAVRRVKDHAPFVVIDVAQTETGEWIVIELNDGQMSGLSAVDPKVLYRRLHEVLSA
jgi:hypothetical protein